MSSVVVILSPHSKYKAIGLLNDECCDYEVCEVGSKVEFTLIDVDCDDSIIERLEDLDVG